MPQPILEIDRELAEKKGKYAPMTVYRLLMTFFVVGACVGLGIIVGASAAWLTMQLY